MRRTLFLVFGLMLECSGLGPLVQLLACLSLRAQAAPLIEALLEDATRLDSAIAGQLRPEHANALLKAQLQRLLWTLQGCQLDDDMTLCNLEADSWSTVDVMYRSEPPLARAWRDSQRPQAAASWAVECEKGLVLWYGGMLFPLYTRQQWDADEVVLDELAELQPVAGAQRSSFLLYRSARLRGMLEKLEVPFAEPDPESSGRALLPAQLQDQLDPQLIAQEPDLRCPLCLRRMWDPISLRSGARVDRWCFEMWAWDCGHSNQQQLLCPVTGAALPRSGATQFSVVPREMQERVAGSWARVWRSAAATVAFLTGAAAAPLPCLGAGHTTPKHDPAQASNSAHSVDAPQPALA